MLAGNLMVERVFEDERVLAFHHPQPSAVPHVVVIPKQHVASLLAPEALGGSERAIRRAGRGRGGGLQGRA